MLLPPLPLVALLFVLSISSVVAQTEPEPELFESSPPDVVRWRREVFDRLAPGAAVRLKLPPNAASFSSARVAKVYTSCLGSRIIQGRMEGQAGGSLLLVRHGDVLAGTVTVSPTERYALDGVTLRALAPAQLPLCACASDYAPRLPRLLTAKVVPLTVAAQFDVLAVYTPAALAAEGSEDALIAQAELALEDANTCYRNSGIPLAGRIVGVRAVAYAESGEIRTDLHRLAVPGDGFLDEVQTWRDEVEADLVCMFTRHDSADGFKGYAEILTGLTPDGEVLGFSVVDVQAALVDHLFAHELGHNMGCDHDRENTTGLRLFDFSYGGRFTGLDGTLYRDVMAYPPGASVPYFGTPGVSFAGTPTGVAEYTDTARTLIASAPAFVNFRAADGRSQVSVIGSDATGADATGAGKRAKFVFERTGAVAQPLTVTYQSGGSALGGSNYKALSGQAAFPAGSHFATTHVKPLLNAAPFGAGTVSVTLQPGDGYVPADAPDGAAPRAAVTIYDRLPLVNLGKARRVGQGMGKLKVRITRLGATDEDLVVHYTLGGKALPGVDYRPPAKETVMIRAGKSGASLFIHLVGPTAQAGTIEVTVSPSLDYNLGENNSKDITL